MEKEGEFDFELDFKNTELSRGETPKDIEMKCHNLCGEYLGGAWLKITPQEMVFRRIKGGLTNQLYYCGIPDGVQLEDDQPNEVAIRIYGEKHFYNEDDEDKMRLNDAVISILMSESKIGPKIYGIFKGGEIQEYIQSHGFFEEEESNPKMVKELAQKLAKIHYTKVPTKKKLRLFKQMRANVKESYERFPIDQLIDDLKLDCLKENDLLKEMDFVERVILKLNPKIVFIHNDFRNTNILVKEKNNEQDKLTICDFEYGHYGYRGSDFGFLFSTWGQHKFVMEPEFVSDDIMKTFFQYYNEECIKINGEEYLKDERNTIESLIREAKIFYLSFSLLGVTFCLCKDHQDDMKFGEKSVNKNLMMQGGNVAFKNYFRFKKRFIEAKIIPDSIITNGDFKSN